MKEPKVDSSVPRPSTFSIIPLFSRGHQMQTTFQHHHPRECRQMAILTKMVQLSGSGTQTSTQPIVHHFHGCQLLYEAL
jgi:hypothetical protein